VTSDQLPRRHRRSGRPIGTIGFPVRAAIIYVCALVASGRTAVGYVVAHHEAWWWLKALLAASVFAVLAALGFQVTRSVLSVTWRDRT
jgi:hypothetical protein